MLIAFHLVGSEFFEGYALDLGSLNFPQPRYLIFVGFWTVFGGLAAALLTVAVSRRWGSQAQIDRLTAEWHAPSDRRFMFSMCAVAFAIPMAIRYGLMRGAPLTDDESAYRFAAELLASGRLWVASPPMKLFFDQSFMINDGRLYPGVLSGLARPPRAGSVDRRVGIINPLLSALTVPPLFRILRHLFGSSWARAGVLLFLTAPFVQIAAATQLSHTSCLMALTWCLVDVLPHAREDGPIRDHAGFAFSFALAFCIRPQSALPIGLPLVVSWGWALWRLDGKRRTRAVLAFLLPTTVLAGLFLGSLWAQNGSPWLIGYSRYGQYMVENDFRFSEVRLRDLTTVAGFDFSELGAALLAPPSACSG